MSIPGGVAVDGTPLQDGSSGGVARYVEALVTHLDPVVDLTVLFDSRRPAPPIGARSVSLRGRGPRLLWLQGAAAAWLRDHPGLCHGTFNSVPVRRRRSAPTVVTIHDLAPQRHPDDFTPAKRLAWRVFTRRAAERADAVLVPSTFIRNEVAAYYGRDETTIHVTPMAASAVFSPERRAAAGAVAGRIGVRVPYVVALGGARRRNLASAVAAWRLARSRLGGALDLLVLGELVPGEPGLCAPGHLSDGDLAAALAGAEAFVYPTRYEGFGMPALEAAACGVPVVCAPVAALPEVLGDAAAWAEAPEPEPIADRLVALLGDADAHRSLRRASLARAAAAPSWADNAAATLEAYRRAAALTGGASAR